MYTVLWEDGTGCHWERCESRTDVVACLLRNAIRDDPDVQIFTPEADDCVICTEDIFAEI